MKDFELRYVGSHVEVYTGIPNVHNHRLISKRM